MVVGILNLLLALLVLFRGVQIAMTPVEQIKEQMEEVKRMFPAYAKAIDEQGGNPEQQKSQSTIMTFSLGGVALVAGLVTLLGGIRMRQVRSYGLALTGS